MREQPNKLDQIVQRAGALYSLPAVAMQVLELTGNPQVDTRELKQCIENDPALTSKVLKVVNSSLFGTSREVRDLNQALALLGTKPLKLLVLGFSLPEGLFADVASNILNRYWRETLTKAVAAREICETIWSLPGDEAFIAGLLKDIGLLVLLHELGEPYVQFLERVHEEGGDLAELEATALGFDHTQLSARLLEHWGLPKLLVQAVAAPTSTLHARLGSESDSTLPQILHLAELLAQLAVQHRIDVLPDLLETGESYHDLTRPQVTELVENLEAKVEQLADVLSIEIPQGKEYRDVLTEAHARMAEIAADVAGDMVRRYSDDLCEGLLEETRLLSEAAADLATGGAPMSIERKLATPAVAATAVESIENSLHDSPQEARGTSTTRMPVREVERGLFERLDTTVANCRSRRCELSLLLVEIDNYEDLIVTHGTEGAQQLAGKLEAAWWEHGHPGAVMMQTQEARFSIILPDCDRRLAAELGNHLVCRVRLLASGPSSDRLPVMRVSVGAATVAIPPKNFPPHDLVESARRCLYGAQSCGGNTVKSIEIY